MSDPQWPLEHPWLAKLARALRDRPGRTVDDAEHVRRAAVTLVHRVRGGAAGEGEVELLLVKRATWAGDPWSGHVALPGGRRESGDFTMEDTAIRETREETSLDLRRGGMLIGSLDEVYPRTPVLPPLVITPFVAVVAGTPELRLSSELAEAFWVPVSALRDPAARREVVLHVAGATRTVSSFHHGGHTIWGITYSILERYLALAVR